MSNKKNQSKWDILGREIEASQLNYRTSFGGNLEKRLSAKWIGGASVEKVCKKFRVEAPDSWTSEAEDFDIRKYVLKKVREQLRYKFAKEKAAEIGLHYWPALLDNGHDRNCDCHYCVEGKGPKPIDPVAFKIAEDILAESHGYWEPLKTCYHRDHYCDCNKNRCHGGWDSAGHWGLCAQYVRDAWYVSGCKNSSKYRLLIRLMSNCKPGDQYLVTRWVKKSYSYQDILAMKKARHFLETRSWLPNVDFFKRTALKALGNLNPAERAAALVGVSEPDSYERGDYGYLKKIRKDDLNWEAVESCRSMNKQDQAAHYVGPKGSWYFLLRQAAPEGLEKVHAYGLKPKFYGQLIKLATEHEGAEEYEVKMPAAQLAKLFGAKGVLEQFKRKVEKDFCEEIAQTEHQAAFKALDAETKKAIKERAKRKVHVHELGQFTLPERGFWNAELWRKFVLRYPAALKYASVFNEVERVLDGKTPKNLKDLRDIASRFTYKGMNPDDEVEVKLGQLCQSQGVSQSQFDKYKQLCSYRKTAESIPHVNLTGQEIGLEGDWVFRKLDAYDPTGPILGLLTDCCQHLDGAGSACAINGWKSMWSGFYVVEYKGRVVAQSWAWRGKRGELCFDSIEALGSAYAEGIGKLYQEASNRMYGQMGVTAITVGDCSYGISRSIFSESVSNPAQMVDRVGYSDAHSQLWVVKGERPEKDVLPKKESPKQSNTSTNDEEESVNVLQPGSGVYCEHCNAEVHPDCEVCPSCDENIADWVG